MGFWGRAERDVLKGSLSLIGASLSCCEFPRSRVALSFYLTEPIHQWLDHSKPKTNSFLLGGLGGWDTMPLFLEAQRRVLWRKQKNPCVSDEVYPPFFARKKNEIQLKVKESGLDHWLLMEGFWTWIGLIKPIFRRRKYFMRALDLLSFRIDSHSLPDSRLGPWDLLSYCPGSLHYFGGWVFPLFGSQTL